MGSIETIVNALLGIMPLQDDGFVGSSTGDVGSTLTPNGVSPL